MRLPRVRFTVRRTMAAVAIVAVAFGVVPERRSRFERIAARCRREQAAVSSCAISLGYNPAVVAGRWTVASRPVTPKSHPVRDHPMRGGGSAVSRDVPSRISDSIRG